MKKYISVLALSALTLGSCSDFLDVQKEGVPTTDTYFNNDQEAIDAVDALYYNFHDEETYGRDLYWEQGATTDIVWGRGRDYNSLATFEYTGNEGPLTNVWRYTTGIVSRSNWVVQQLLNKEAKTPLTPVEKRSLGEAYFTRGWAHFLYAYRYGTPEQGVPFVRYEDFEGGYDNSIPVQRKSVMENFQFIIDDMNKAIEYLPRFEEYDQDDRGRAHEAAAVGLKAKTYAYWATYDKSKWAEVIKLVNELETTYQRGLADTFSELFSSDFNNFWNREYVWSIPGNGVNSGGSIFPGVVLDKGGWGRYNGWGQNKPSLDIYNEMLKDGEGNERLRRSILEYGQEFEYFGEKKLFTESVDIPTGFQINKYMDAFKHKDADVTGYVSGNGNRPTSRVNFPVIRFAELLLFRAEAYLNTGNAAKATEDINRLRKRAKLEPIEGTATMANIYHERRCELAFEFYDHLFDLKRWHLSGDATIKELAKKELNTLPSVRIYEDSKDPNSSFEVKPYSAFKSKNTYQDYMIVFPYPSNEITKSNGQLKQNAGY